MGWPPIDFESLAWQSRFDERTAMGALWPHAHYEAAIPPFISMLDPLLDSRISALARAAENELVRFDSRFGSELLGFAPILLRSEAAASSQIENLTASARAIFTAEFGDTSRRNATEIAGNTKAMQTAITLAHELTVESVLEVHRVLMAGTAHTPGEWRREAVWIGTSSRSPHGADFVAPRFERVPPLMDDLMNFASRTELPVLAQIAVAHAQFETIHPFSDGNGRTGRALVQSMLRAKDLTRAVTVPVSAGLLVDINAYHNALTAYRAGNIQPIVEQIALASVDAIRNSAQLVDELRDIHQKWVDVASPRSGSQLGKALTFASRQPVFTTAMLAAHLDVALPNVYPHTRKLVELGVLQQKNEHGIGQVFRADDVLAALDRFADRAGRRTT